MNSWNPAFSKWVLHRADLRPSSEGAMKIKGAVNRTAILLILTFGAVLFAWTMYSRIGSSLAIWIGLFFLTIAGVHICFFTMLKMNWSSVTGPLFAIAEGFVVGGLSAVIDGQLPGIAVQAVLLWFAVCGAMLASFTVGIIKLGRKLRSGAVAGALGVVVYCLTVLVVGPLGINLPLPNTNDPLGIMISLLIMIMAAVNLALDFDMVLSLADQGTPKYMEWYAGFSLVLTLAWMYLYVVWFVGSRGFRLLSTTR
jgi:uncharacterized YccA/Bax inhibitor family protein